VKYSLKVRLNVLDYIATLTTCNVASTHSTYAFYTGESDTSDSDSASSDSVADQRYEDVEKLVEDAVSTIPTEIRELDTIAFDETLVFDESVDM
jgi:hypothetical protein